MKSHIDLNLGEVVYIVRHLFNRIVVFLVSRVFSSLAKLPYSAKQISSETLFRITLRDEKPHIPQSWRGCLYSPPSFQ